MTLSLESALQIQVPDSHDDFNDDHSRELLPSVVGRYQQAGRWVCKESKDRKGSSSIYKHHHLSLSPAKSDKTPFRWLWWRSTILPGTWEIIWTICLHLRIIPLAEVQWLNAEMIKQWEWFPLTSNHSTQSQSGMREATHPVPLIRERIVLLNFVKTKYSHRLTFDIGPWFLACASVSGRNLINITILRAFYQAMVQYVQRSSRSIIYWSNTNFTVRCLLA